MSAGEQSAPDVVSAVAYAVDELKGDLDRLVGECTAPDAADLAELLLQVRTARESLHSVERDVEAQTAKAMMGDILDVPGTLRADRSRPRKRVEWDYDEWTRDVRDKALRKHGLLGAHVVNADGEEADARTLYDALTEVQTAQTKGPPRKTALRDLGLDADEYCATSTAPPTVRVYRDAGTPGGEEL